MKQTRKKYTQDEIDVIVAIEADDKNRWSDPIRVKPTKAVILHLDSKTIESAKRIARTKRLKNYAVWFERIIKKEVDQAQKKRILA